MTDGEYRRQSATNPDVYPITAAFEAWATEHNVDDEPTNHSTIRNCFVVMAGNIGEYEHGSVDWDRPIDEYVAVCKDVLLTLVSVIGNIE
jgi:hypothetical protein